MAAASDHKAPSTANDAPVSKEEGGDTFAIDMPYTEEEERAVVRRIDLVILPFVSRHLTQPHIF